LQSFEALDTETLSMPAGFFTVLISLLFFACLAAFGAAAERVRIAVSSKSLSFLDALAAKERGFYRKYGLEAAIITMCPPLTVAALQLDPIIVERVLRERRQECRI
jgi:hypothetical protein